MLRGVNFEYDDGFKFGYNNPLEQLGLYMKRDEDEEEKETNGSDGVDVEEELDVEWWAFVAKESCATFLLKESRLVRSRLQFYP
ncbi:hypothetical protein L6452_25035 [Arctium lappa]|uniref:Uncharacterized protein n=1 Tax=Arctium lappa TaxID=4217 RepID=A0ACB9AAC0_ARCLA|nr:hypothetical protein L6452_25035 [Arctium lappa]